MTNMFNQKCVYLEIGDAEDEEEDDDDGFITIINFSSTVNTGFFKRGESPKYKSVKESDFHK